MKDSLFNFKSKIIKSSLYSRYYAEACSGGTNFRGLASGQHSSKKTSQRWRTFGDTMATGPARKSKSDESRILCDTAFMLLLFNDNVKNARLHFDVCLA